MAIRKPDQAIRLSALDEIEAFIAELRADPRGGVIDEKFEETLRTLYRSDDPATIEICDSVCAIIRRTDRPLIERMTKLLPIFARFAFDQG